ncbi:RNA polymerase III transcription factor subunit [Penicillium sp. IBT 18751x]|nr:RNA polymerase III transcription factor subunit [Penicillium sp. IBT 18751x]
MESQRDSRTAPFYPVPPRRLVSVEHPAVIQNLDRAVDTLQGNAGIQNILNPPKADTPAQLSLRPEDVMARQIQSISCPSNNVLLKVTVPKRTGRKRKRGSDEPFTEASSMAESPTRQTSKDLLRNLQDNASKYRIEAVGKIERTHLFRGLPDFMWSSTRSSFTNQFSQHITPYDLDEMKKFQINMSKGAITDVDIIPPPSFTQGDIPFQYMYRQNPTVKQAVDESGKTITVNTQQPTKIRSHLVAFDIPVVPSEPQEDLAPIDSLDPILRGTIERVKKLFEERPAWTRRAIRSYLASDEQQPLLRHALPYVGYIFRSGPWRDAIIKLGVDPRTSPEYRHYQTFMFRVADSNEADLDNHNSVSGSAHADTHIFTGQLPLPRDGRIWMAGDIKDPILASILYPADPPPSFLRSECEIISDGWFGNGTMAKVKTIMRAKIAALVENSTAPDSEFRRIALFPDHASSEEDLAAYFTVDPATSSSKEISYATEVRASIKGAPLWRRKNEKESYGMEKRPGRGGPRKRGKMVEFEGVDANNEPEQSEGEEEEMQRKEILEEQVAAALAARDAVQEGEEGEEGDNDEDEGEDVDEDDDDN